MDGRGIFETCKNISLHTTWGLAIAGQDLVSFGYSLLSTLVLGLTLVIWHLVFIFNFGFSIGFGYRLDIIKSPAITKP